MYRSECGNTQIKLSCLLQMYEIMYLYHYESGFWCKRLYIDRTCNYRLDS